MTVVNWNCWIGDEEGGNQVLLSGIWQPKPRPWPKKIQNGSDHVMLDGTVDAQRFSYRQEITFTLPNASRSQKEALEALYERWDETTGQQKKIQCNNGGTSDGGQTFLCSWKSAISCEPKSDRLPERWLVECPFLIESVVEE